MWPISKRELSEVGIISATFGRLALGFAQHGIAGDARLQLLWGMCLYPYPLPSNFAADPLNISAILQATLWNSWGWYR
jgi:hypothetical protein